MSKNLLTSLIVVAVLVAGLILVARGRGNEGGSQRASGKLAADHAAYDFGRISMAAGKVRHTFMMKNESGEPLNIRQMYTSCMCTTATWKQAGESNGPFGMPGHGLMPQMNRMMGAGQEAAVEVEFDPAAHGPAGVGKILRDVIVETDEGTVTLSVSAEVAP